ncbi:MAG: hypothetical protein RR139_12230 [Lachnospiraceae bacterium]
MLEYLKFNIGSYFGGNVDVTVTVKNGVVTANVESILHPDYPRGRKGDYRRGHIPTNQRSDYNAT